MNKASWEPKTIPGMVDEMLAEAYRLSGCDKNKAIVMMKWLAGRDPEIRQALALWYLDRYPEEIEAVLK